VKYTIVGTIRTEPNAVMQIAPMRNAIECHIVDRPSPPPGDQVLGEFHTICLDVLPLIFSPSFMQFVCRLGLLNNAERVTVEDEQGYLLVDFGRNTMLQMGNS
jgi:hypothetical protein